MTNTYAETENSRENERMERMEALRLKTLRMRKDRILKALCKEDLSVEEVRMILLEYERLKNKEDVLNGIEFIPLEEDL